MADIGGDWGLDQQRIRMDVATHLATIEKQKHELLQLAVRRKQIIVNIRAIEDALVDVRARLEDSIEAHGEAPPIDLG